MKVPSRRFVLGDGLLVCEPREKEARAVQAHLLQHPVGITSLARGGVWTEESWEELGVIDDATRSAFISQVLRLRVGNDECSVPELRGAPGVSLPGAIACHSCPVPLAQACAHVAAPTIGGRYLGVLDDMLEALSTERTARVSRGTLVSRLFGALRSAGQLTGLVVAYAGLDARTKRSIIVRLNRGDGVRAELYFEEPDQLSWRTLYRDPQAIRTPNGRIQFLLDAPPQANSTMALSELCLVSHLFWETK